MLSPNYAHFTGVNTATVRLISTQTSNPETPVVNAVTVFCQSAVPTVVSLKSRYGNNIRVYTSETATNFLEDRVRLNHDQTYFISGYEPTKGESVSRSQTEIFISDPKLQLSKNNVCGDDEVTITASGVPPTVQDFELANPNFEKFLEYDNASYFLRRESMSWTNAYDLIQSLGAGATMYIINNKAEEDAVYDALRSLGVAGTSGTHLWLGLRQIPALNPNNTTDGGWQWLDGRMLTDDLANWSPNEPNDADAGGNTVDVEDGSEDFGQFDFHAIKTWNDMSDNNPSGNSWPVFEFTGTTKVTWGQIDPATGKDVAFADSEKSVIEVNPLETTTYFYEFRTAGIVCREEVVVTVIDTPELLPANDLELCAGPTETIDVRDRSQNFDLAAQQTAILNGTPSTEVLFFTSQYNAENLTGTIDASIPFTNTINPQLMYYRTRNTITGCPSIETGTFNLNILSPPEIIISPHYECDDITSGSDTDQIQTFDLTLNNERIFQLMGATAAEYSISYHLSMADANDLTLQGITQYTTLAADAGNKIIYVRMVDNNLGCYRVTNYFHVVVSPLPILANSVVVHKECDESTDVIDGRLRTNLTYFNHLISTNYENESFAYFSSPDYTPASEITNPTSYFNTDAFGNPKLPTDDIYVKVNSILPINVFAPYGSCSRDATIKLEVSNSQIDPNFNLDFYMCETEHINPDGSTIFPASIFTNINTALINQHPAFAAANVSIRYFPSLADAAEKKNEINPVIDYTNPNSVAVGQNWTDKIWVSVETAVGDTLSCMGLAKVATLHIERLPRAHDVTTLRECDDNGDGFEAFDTSTVNDQLLRTQSQTAVDISFYDAATGALLFNDALPNPYVSTSKTIRVRVENNPSTITPACYDEVTFDLIVDSIPLFNAVPAFESCDETDGIIDGAALFDTQLLDDAILQGQSNVAVNYFTLSGDVLPSPLPVDFTTKSTTLSVTLVNTINPNCRVSGSVSFNVLESPDFDIDEAAILCLNAGTQQIEVRNPLATYSYNWEYTSPTGEEVLLPDMTRQIEATKAGIYTVTATNTLGNGCSNSKSITLTTSSSAEFTRNDVTITDNIFSPDNTIEIDTSNLGVGDYEFALNDEPYQDNPIFNDVKSGTHIITIRDKNGCGVRFLSVTVLGYPKFFSPNQDGFNDEWKIITDNDGYSISEIYIFDRYGRLLTLLSCNNSSWDGTFRGNPMPADDYWFRVKLDDGRSFTGHFSLIR